MAPTGLLRDFSTFFKFLSQNSVEKARLIGVLLEKPIRPGNRQTISTIYEPIQRLSSDYWLLKTRVSSIAIKKDTGAE
jgi:hypothetical protein